MHRQQVREIYQVMADYTRKGKKSEFKKKQMKRLIVLLDNIIQNEPSEDLKKIGRKQIIGYYKRHSHESYQTLNEKSQVLKKFMSSFNPKVTVPNVDPNKAKQEVGNKD